MIREEPVEVVSSGLSFLCSKHWEEVGRYIEELSPHTVEANTKNEAEECIMCKVPPKPDAKCEYCGCELHPQWPALYCTNKCASEDS